MSKVYIEGFKMPKSCMFCPFNVQDCCSINYCCLIEGVDGLMPDDYEDIKGEKLPKCPLREEK